MNRDCVRRGAMASAVAALLVLSPPAGAGEAERKVVASDIELMCLTEQPATVEGESVTLRAWASTPDGRPVTAPITFTWEVNAGRVDAQAAATRWDLASVKVGGQVVRKVTATVTATRAGGGEARCVVQVLIAKKDEEIGILGGIVGAIVGGILAERIRGEKLLSAKRYLLPGEVEAPGYGLYSYVLFAAPPRDTEENARYLKIIEAYLLVLQDVERLLGEACPSEQPQCHLHSTREGPGYRKVQRRVGSQCACSL